MVLARLSCAACGVQNATDTMPWSFRRTADTGTLVFAGGGARVPWLHRGVSGGELRFGVLERDVASDAELARRWRDSGLPRRAVRAVLPLAETHWLQIEAPPVPPEEWREAARWRAAEYIDTPPTELALDVMPVGDGKTRGTPQIFVVAAPQQRVQRLDDDARALGWELAVIEVAETAQRNLQTAVVAAAGLGARASAALVRHGQQALLTLCAGGELFLARRLELAPPAQPPLLGAEALELALDGDFVDYGALDEPALAEDPLLVELQRSFDVWERTWPDQPLAGLWIELGDDTAARQTQLQQQLGLPVQRLDAAALFDRFDGPAAAAALGPTYLPLLGTLLRPQAD